MQAHHSSDQIPRRRDGHAAQLDLASRSASFDRRGRSDDSWVEISSQPSSSSLSSINDEIVTTGLRVQHDPRYRKRRALRPGAPSHLNISHRAASAGAASSQEEYEESESESDRVMTSSNEGGLILNGRGIVFQSNMSPAVQSTASEDSNPMPSDDDDENRTAINYPINNETCFTPQPNAFSHPPSSGQSRNASAPVPGSYFPSTRPQARPTARPSLSAQPSHMPQNILSPSYSAAAHHDEALRASLSTLLSCAAAARGLPKTSDAIKRPHQTAQPRSTGRVEPISFRLVPESAVPTSVASPPQFLEPTFHPTLRRTSTSTSAASSNRLTKETKRKALATNGRSASRERRVSKKARRASSSEDLQSAITPTLLTWVVSAGVVVVLSAALSFSAGYSLGKEAGRLEAGGFGASAADEQLRSCAREAGRSGMGLRRSLAGATVQV